MMWQGHKKRKGKEQFFSPNEQIGCEFLVFLVFSLIYCHSHFQFNVLMLFTCFLPF
eukprot:08183.XXX_284917_285084_1 [CDS] Oithona nana genome sequencing.